MSHERLQEIHERLEKITPGPWHAYISETGSEVVSEEGWVCQLWYKTEEPMKNHACNADFIAHAPDDVAFLLTEVERLQKALQGAATVSNVAGAEMKALRKENERLLKALKDIFCYYGYEGDRAYLDMKEIARQALAERRNQHADPGQFA